MSLRNGEQQDLHWSSKLLQLMPALKRSANKSRFMPQLHGSLRLQYQSLDLPQFEPEYNVLFNS